MSEHIPLNQQGRLPKAKLKPLFQPKKIMWLRVQGKNYDNLRKREGFQHVQNLPSTDDDIAGIKRLTKKMGADVANSPIIDLVDPTLLEFRSAFNKAQTWLLEGAELGEKRCLFYYYTGHGFQQNYTQAALNVNHEVKFKFDMEEQLSALTEIDNVYVVAIFDCCREDISRLAKDSGARASDSAAGGNFLVLYGCKPSGKRDVDNLMASTLEAKIQEAVHEFGDGTNFLMHTVFDDFYINGKFLPEHHEMRAHLCLEYRPDGQGFTYGQEREETKEPAINNQSAHLVSQAATQSSAQAQGNLPTAQMQINQQPDVVVIAGQQYYMESTILDLYTTLYGRGVTGGEVMPQLANSSMKSLNFLDLSKTGWWTSGQSFPQLRIFLGRQTQLAQFEFHSNALTTLQTMQLLQCIAQSNKQLTCLGLRGSCNFDSDESVTALAQCIDQCRVMTQFINDDQQGARKVKVVYTAGQSISVVIKGTNNALHSMPTTRTSIIYIYDD